MPDITLCADNDCPRKELCKRHIGHWLEECLSGRQSYCDTLRNEDDTCDYFIKE